MTQEQKMRSFKEWFANYGAKAQPMFYFTEHMRNCWQAATAHAKQEMVEKLEGEDVQSAVALAMLNGLRLSVGVTSQISSLDAMLADDKAAYLAESKAALTEIKKLLMEG